MSTDRGIDRLLDRAIFPGYSSLGFSLRRRGWADTDPRPDALLGKRALVTGAGGGLGEATALGLARLGATVHLLVRSRDRARSAYHRIDDTLGRQGLTARLEVEVCDVSDLTSVRRFATGFAERLEESSDALDLVVHNAGVMPRVRTTSVDGHELTLATHVLGPVLMTELLRPALRRSEQGARTILVSSGGMYTQQLPVGDLDFNLGRYRGSVAYARSKRVQVQITPTLAERWAADRVSVYAMHPGWADTPGVASSLPLFRALTRPFLRSSEAGADTAVWLAATDPAPPSGTFWHDRQRRPTSYSARTSHTPAQVAEVWDEVLAKIGGPDSGPPAS